MTAPAVDEGQFHALAEMIPQLVWSTTADGYHDYYNARWFEYTGMPREGAQGRNWKNFLHPDDYERTVAVWANSLATGEPYDIEYRFKRASDGAYRWFIGRALPLRGPDGAIVRWFGTCTDIDDQKRAEDALRVLAGAGEVLAGALDSDAALARVARIVVPRVADWCAIDVVDGAGVRRVAVAHSDPSKAELATRLAERYPDAPDAAVGVGHVLRTGRLERADDIPDAVLASIAHDAEHLRMIGELGLVSYVIAPMLHDGAAIGAITLVSAESGRRFTDDDVRTAEEIARRTALALGTANAYRESERQREQLAEQATELELQREHLQEQTGELEMQNEQLAEQATELELQSAHMSEQAHELEAQASQLEQYALETEARNAELQETVTATRASESRLALALDAGALGWWEWDIPTGRVTWSPQAEALYGVTAATFDGTLDTFRSLIHPDDLDRVEAALAQTLAERRPTYSLTHRIVRRSDGAMRSVEAHGRLVLAPDGAPERLLGVVADVTERHALLESETAARREAEAANRAKSEFLATMSHELRTPLNAIAGYADLLMLGIRGPISEMQLGDIGRIKRSGQHLLALINDILNFARLEAGRVEFDASDVSLRDLLDGAEALIGPQVRERGLTYVVGLCDDQLAVRADGEKVQQVLLNLLTNAIKFTDRGGRVSVQCESDDRVVRIDVSDTGRGIPADKLGSIFEPFVQVDRQLNPSSQQGVGLGLAISRDLARGMGGDLEVSSEPGEGSTFTLTLPRAASPAASTAAAAT